MKASRRKWFSNYGSSSVQTIQTKANNTETFNNLTINNTSRANDAVTLNSPVFVSGIFTLIDGIVLTSSADLLVIVNPATAAVVEGATNTYVWGPYKKHSDYWYFTNGAKFSEGLTPPCPNTVIKQTLALYTASRYRNLAPSLLAMLKV